MAVRMLLLLAALACLAFHAEVGYCKSEMKD
jgi:hypothetical protein